jgi:uncharacterized protein YbgA (DUF1722 family)/uncharacterized protein YbbK (DUF523 family)
MAAARKPRLGISSCLLGHKVRYDGQHKRHAFLVDTLGPLVEWVPVCPELEVGMGVPREPIHLLGASASPRLVGERSGTDWTGPMGRWAARRVEELAPLELRGWVTKKGSPSCGLERVPVRPERGGTPRRDGVGAFVRVLCERFPLLPVEEEGRLEDPALRESFIERVFTFDRWCEARDAGLTRGALVAFHAAHKLLVMAHSPAHYRRLGALVGTMPKGPATRTAEAYGALLMEALAVPATRGRHLNALGHAVGYFRDRLDEADRKELEETVKGYGRGHVPLVVPITLLRHHLRRDPVPWLADQVYLAPGHAELMLRNHV